MNNIFYEYVKDGKRHFISQYGLQCIMKHMGCSNQSSFFKTYFGKRTKTHKIDVKLSAYILHTILNEVKRQGIKKVRSYDVYDKVKEDFWEIPNAIQNNP